MYNRFSPPNQSSPNAQRNYPYGPPPGPQGPPYQPTQQPQQHSPAVLQHGLSTHNNASQFSNFNHYNNSSRMNTDLRGGYSAHIGSHQPQQPHPLQSWASNTNKAWSADLGASGGTNSTTNHSMLSSGIYSNNGPSGSNTGAFAQSPSLFSATAPQQQQQPSPQQTRRIQTMATSRLSGDGHTFSGHQPLGAHNQQSLSSLAAFHTSPTPAAQTQTHSTHNNNNNSNMLSLPTPNSSSATLMRQQIYPMDTNNNMNNMNNMNSLSSIGNMVGMSSLGNVGFPRSTMSVNDATNMNTFVEVDTTSNEIDADSLIDNSLVTPSSLPSNTPSAQASISPSNQQNYMGNNNINNRYPQSQHTTPTQLQRRPPTRYNTPSSSTSPNTSISSITDSSSGHSSSASVNNNANNKRPSADSSSVYNTPTMNAGIPQRNPNVNYSYIMSGQSGQQPSYPNQQAAQQQQQQTPQQQNVAQSAQQKYINDFIPPTVNMNYSSQQNASSTNPQQPQQSQQQQQQQQIQQQQLQHHIQQNQTHQQASRSPYQSYTTSPHLQPQHMHQNQTASSISSPRAQKPTSKKSSGQSGIPNQVMPPPQLHSQPSQIQQQAQQTPQMHQHNQIHQQQQNQSQQQQQPQQQLRHPQPMHHQQQQQQQQQLQQPPQQQQNPQLQQLQQHIQPIQQHHPQQTQQPQQPPDSQIQMQQTTPKPMGRVINQQQPSSFPTTNVSNIQNTPKSAKNAPVTHASSSSSTPRTNNNINNNVNNNINNNINNSGNSNNTSSLPPQESSSDIPTNHPPSKEHKPKRPMNAFIIFSSERRPELQKNDPNMQTAQVSKILGEEWQNMDPTRKEMYNARARQLKEDFKQSNPDFVYTRRGSSNSAKKRPTTPSTTTASTSSNNKSQSEPIAVPPQSSNMPMSTDSLNGVPQQHHTSNTYTSSPHQHSSSTPQRSSPTINRQNNSTPSLPPSTQPPQQRSTPQQPIGTSSSSTSTSTPTTTPNRKDNKLKRPMNAFLIFNKEMRPKVLEMNPNMTVAEISKTIGENWRSMTEEQRDQYLQKARELKNEFHETHPDFVYTRRSKAELAAAGHHSYSKKRHFNRDDSDSDDDQNNQNNNNHREGSPSTSPLKDPRGRKKKRSRHPTAPKHPMSGFLFYALEMRPHVAEQNPGSTVGPISKIIASHWKSLTPEQRERWEKKATDDKARYAREMEAYLQDQKDNE